MQAVICSLIILIAALYTLNRWLPAAFKQRLSSALGKSAAINGKESKGACGSCSSCGNCGSNVVKIVRK